MSGSLLIDIESYSEVPITHGTHAYAEKAEVLLIPWAWDDEPVTVWDTQDVPDWRERLQAMVDAADEVCCHNSHFDRTVLRHCGVTIPTHKIIDTMVLALQHSLPGSLGALCDVLQVPQDKSKDAKGKKLIQLFTKPRPKNMKLRRADRGSHPEEWQEFIEYARLDVDATRAVYRRLPRWNDSHSERALWLLDQRTGDTGVRVDLDLARSALRAFERTSRSLAAAAGVLTDGEVGSLTQRQKLIDHLRDKHDFTPADLTKGTVSGLLKRDDLTGEVRELLEIRQQAAATSPAKYKVLLNATSSDGRLRGTMQFCGASRTGRDAGRLFQPQNLPRPSMTYEQIELGIAAMKADCEDLIFDNVSELCASAVRGCIIAPEGRKLVVADLSNIEGRVLAWLADEQWKLEAFRAYDRGTGHDLYKITAGRILNKDPGAVTKEERQLQGKVPELAGGFGGALGAYRKMGGPVFDAMDDGDILAIVKAWRRQHPATVSLWYAVEQAAKDAIRNPDNAFAVRNLMFDMKQGWLRIKLPSGRYLSYPNARVQDGQIVYDGVNQYTRKWETLETYYGRLVENLVQAIARDVFMGGMKRAMEAGYEVVIRVHDELVCEVPDVPEYNVDGLVACMVHGESWSLGLPLAAAGNCMTRYCKAD